MVFTVLTLFPRMFESPMSESMIKRAVESGVVRIEVIDIREYASGKHKQADDRPYGGGSGMILMPQPVAGALKSALKGGNGKKHRTILLSPVGGLFTQDMARNLSHLERLILICGHYEGLDERIREIYVDDELSIGDYILTGGELAAMVVIDAVTRLIPGVLGDPNSVLDESFSASLLEYPQYTRPEVFENRRVPEVLLSGHHENIRRWRRKERLRRTLERRPDLLANQCFNQENTRAPGIGQRGAKELGGLKPSVFAALVHFPVYSKNWDVIASAVTNLDIHDLGRLAATYGLLQLYLVTPLVDQKNLVHRILRYWLTGAGAKLNPDRAEALKKVSISEDISSVVTEIERKEGQRPIIYSTGANLGMGTIGYPEAREIIRTRNPHLLLFGTGWGLAQEMHSYADYTLEPIKGCCGYNHLSVRSAAAIILDRLLS